MFKEKLLPLVNMIFNQSPLLKASIPPCFPHSAHLLCASGFLGKMGGVVENKEES